MKMKQMLPIANQTKLVAKSSVQKTRIGCRNYFLNSGIFFNNRKVVRFFDGQISERISPHSITSSSS
jgi:hypothetical protein